MILAVDIGNSNIVLGGMDGFNIYPCYQQADKKYAYFRRSSYDRLDGNKNL